MGVGLRAPGKCRFLSGAAAAPFWVLFFKGEARGGREWHILCLDPRLSPRGFLLRWGGVFCSNAASSYGFLESSIPCLPTSVLLFLPLPLPGPDSPRAVWLELSPWLPHCLVTHL